ncbi:TetR/AcrR family transcriptional regulator [Undibacterium sp. TS12]|uniref:TetR/AcrR family transcriptional regulator n=1 Tax=Undibacterium sp. TS12 TaxID=2908202 RepID=UPI001F4CBE74|nr:TetR/AcrR family transcriptional regulator [Undibacterium sp. TS12]MCH8619317.1 TetR/AcrR family transcriptional regulator [Undibacterium sp. TS12]
MARPSQQLDEVLLQSGRTLFPLHGCNGLSLRMLAEHAGVNVGMFHYHFKNKDNYLGQLLQTMYEELFVQLQAEVSHAGSPLQRLRQALCLLARMLREHGNWIGCVWTDAANGEKVARQFLEKNASRHVQLIIGLLMEAMQAGELTMAPPMQSLSFLMGSVVAPMLIAPRALDMGFVPPMLQAPLQQVLSDEWIAERVNRALFALAATRQEIEND